MAIEKISQGNNNAQPIEKKPYVAPEAQDIKIDFSKSAASDNKINKMALQCGMDGAVSKDMALQCGMDNFVSNKMSLQCGAD